MPSFKIPLLIFIVVLIFGIGFTFYTHNPRPKVRHQPVISENDSIIEGQGWKHIVLGTPNDEIMNMLGKPNNIQTFSDAYFYDYYKEGIEINLNRSSNMVDVIFFYNNQADRKQYSAFNKKTSKNIGFDNSLEDVTQKYGKPQKDFSGNDKGIEWRRLAYSNIDFYFENGKMVRISVF